MIEVFLTSFIAAATFGIIFNAPRTSIVTCGLVGMIGWAIYEGLAEMLHMNDIFATFLASLIVASISQIFARIYRIPVIVFTVGGIIPLVPGGLSYDTMRLFVINDYTAAIASASRVFLLSGAIAFGLVMSGVLSEIFRKKPRNRLKGNIADDSQ
ncbi:threonine/serine exporter family protein [Camelliibacillus cellulosilyticus]|uniref:Threonine/serine exporter family protein n=1 Tax=Camelliibacillus cellulosilyticus TaxID=2174486 RepID=A0ABV9GHG4_9BACL